MRHSKSSLFLMELIIAILFFALASTVCIQLFAKAHLLSKQTVEENHALVYAQNLAEQFLAADGNTETMKGATGIDELVYYYDNDWNAADFTNAVYEARLKTSTEDAGIITANITVASVEKAEDPIYTLTVKHHSSQRNHNMN